jgi:hypothetical protein
MNPFVKDGVLKGAVFMRSPALVAAQALKNQEILLSSISDDDDEILSAMEVTADKNLRSFAASLAIEWAKSGENDYDSMEGILVGAINDTEDEGDISEDDQEDVDNLLSAVAQFILDSTDITSAQVQTFFEDEDDDLAMDIADAIMGATKGKSEDEIIANYAEKQAMLLSAVKKVVRDGKTVLIKKRTKKRRMSPAQKAALKKARLKSNTSAARANRKKSNRLRKSKGM